MAQLGMNYDPSQVKDDRETIPDAEAPLQVIESDVVATKNGNGTLLKLTYEVLEGPFAKRRIWDQINIAHSNPQAQEIGQRQLKRLAEAMGISGAFSDSSVLHFKPFRGTIRTETQAGYDPRNVVKGFKPYGSNVQPLRQPQDPQQAQQHTNQTYPQQQPPQQQAAAGGGSRPWNR